MDDSVGVGEVASWGVGELWDSNGREAELFDDGILDRLISDPLIRRLSSYGEVLGIDTTPSARSQSYPLKTRGAGSDSTERIGGVALPRDRAGRLRLSRH